MTTPSPSIPAAIEKVLRRFRSLGREEKMAALVSYARKLEPLPERYRDIADEAFSVPECQTPVRLFPELDRGRIRFHADIDARQSPTVAAFLSIVFQAVNGEPPATTLAIPPDFVRVVMESVGLGTREVGLEAIVARLKRYARTAEEEGASVASASEGAFSQGASPERASPERASSERASSEGTSASSSA